MNVVLVDRIIIDYKARARSVGTEYFKCSDISYNALSISSLDNGT